MGDSVRLNLSGLTRLGLKTRAEIVVKIRQALDPIFHEAGKRLIITTGNQRGDLNIDFDSNTNTKGSDVCALSFLGEDAGETVFVRAHRDLSVCGPIDQKIRKQDTRKVLTRVC